MAKLSLSPASQRDLTEIKTYIEGKLGNPEAAVSTVGRITKALRILRDFPESGTPLSAEGYTSKGFRYLISGNYLVFYRIEEDNVRIARVLYGRRDYLRELFGDTAVN